ncbi:hypothetical protein C8J57DRAFT_1594931 [Mycena rebaudengoi]|nr:hypothetical protein C8J57DRAFT_1594931 [Mycena rebaudengoi]
MRSPSIVAFLVGMLIPITLAAPTVENAETVRTPVGYRLKSNVHEVPAGGSIVHVGDDVHLLDANGTILHVAANVSSDATLKRRAFKDGLVTYAFWENRNSGIFPVSTFQSTWTVPPFPAVDRGQFLQLFNGMEPSSPTALALNVLQFLSLSQLTAYYQYGASASGGGHFWSAASWYNAGDSSFHSPLRFTLTSNTATSFDYKVSFTSIAGSTITITNSPELNFALIALYSLGVAAVNNYPAGSTVFSNVNMIERSNPSGTSVSWSKVDDSPDGLFTTINADGSFGAKITITY